MVFESWDSSASVWPRLGFRGARPISVCGCWGLPPGVVGLECCSSLLLLAQGGYLRPQSLQTRAVTDAACHSRLQPRCPRLVVAAYLIAAGEGGQGTDPSRPRSRLSPGSPAALLPLASHSPSGTEPQVESECMGKGALGRCGILAEKWNSGLAHTLALFQKRNPASHPLPDRQLLGEWFQWEDTPAPRAPETGAAGNRP